MNYRVVFMGSPEFALPCLQRLAEHFSVVGVVTQPDRPAGRGMQLTPPPVKLLADRLRIAAIQPARLREPAAWEQLQAWQPDLIVVTAFGQILRQNVLDLPRYGCINVHASLLPRWRGAAPIQASLLHGDPQTGVTIMRMDAGVDTGPLLAQRVEPILPEDTAATLAERLSHLGADLLVETLPGYLEGTIRPQPQDDSQATRAAMIQKEEGLLDFSAPAQVLAWKVRAFNPWPGTFFPWQEGMLKVHRAHPAEGQGAAPGERQMIQGKPAVRCGQGWLVLDEVQPPGKKAMPGEVFLRGARQWLEGSH
jgi:methionyl-tRNA formyltransferase